MKTTYILTTLYSFITLNPLNFASAQSNCIQIIKNGRTFGFDPTDQVFFRTANEGQLRGVRIVPSTRGQCLQQEGLQVRLDDGKVLGSRYAFVINGGPRQTFEPKAVLGVTSPFARISVGPNRFRLRVNRDDANLCLTANGNDFLDVEPCASADVFTVTQTR